MALAGCCADGTCTDDRHGVVDVTSGAIALLNFVEACATRREKAWYTQSLRNRTWRAHCSTPPAADAVMLKLIGDGALDFKAEDAGGVKSLALSVNREGAAALLALLPGSDLRIFVVANSVE